METLSTTDLASIALLGPLATALVLALSKGLRCRGWPAIGLSVAAASVSLALAITLLLVTDPSVNDVVEVSWLPQAGSSLVTVGVKVDGVSTIMLLVVTLVAWAVQVYSIGYLHDESPADRGRYFTYHSLFIFSMNALVLAPNLLQLFFGWELVGLTSYLLIGYYFKKSSAGYAAVKAFWVTKFADMGLVLGLVTLYSTTHGFAFDARIAGPMGTVTTMLLLVAVMGKSAQFPLHVWLPNAMEGPTPVSALLHAATMVAAGVFLLVRASPLFLQTPFTLECMLWVGAITALFAAVIALYQSDIKRVLAFSTCSQLGYMVAAVGVGAPAAAYFHLTTHAFFKALLFLGAGSVIHAVHSNEVASMGGLGKRMPITAGTFALGALALAGVPGLSGFFSKDLILESVFERGQWGPLALLLLAAFLTAFYMARITILVFWGTPSTSAAHAQESPIPMTAPLVILAAGTVGAGWIGEGFASRVGAIYAFHLGLVGTAGTSLGMLGLFLAWLVYGKRAVAFEDSAWFIGLGSFVRSRALDRFYEWLFASAVMRLANVIAWFDRYVIDGIMNWFGWASMLVGRRLRRSQTGNVLDYVTALAAAMAALVAWRLFS